MTILELVVILFGVFFILLFLNIPIFASLGLASLTALIVSKMPMSMMPVILFTTTSKFTLLAIPFFILAGLVMERVGISGKLVALIDVLIGHIRGGLGIVAVISCCLFSAISGSAPATVAAIGLILIPAMTKAGYSKSFSTALVASSAEVDILIPPSIALVVYGVISETSIGELFMAGMIPGILIGLSLMISVVLVTLKRGYGRERRKRATLREAVKAFFDASWGLLAPFIILGGIYGGVFTPTESAAVAAVYGILVGIFVYRNLNVKDLFRLLVDTAVASAIIMVIVMNASVFAWMLTTGRVAQTLFQIVTAMTTNYIFVLIALNVLLLVAGCFMDAISAYYIFIPLFSPICLKLGIDPVHLGIIMTTNLAIGLITPPVGVDLYTASAISGVPFKDICRDIWPFLVPSVLSLILITYVPAISLWLPQALGMR